MSKNNSESQDGPGWLVYLVAALVWGGIKNGVTRSKISTRHLSSVSARVGVTGSNALQRRINASQSQEKSSSPEQPTINQDNKEFQKLRDSLVADRRTLNLDWALGAVKNQKREGACTAFSISAAIEVMLKAQFHIDGQIDALRYWSSYGTPSFEVAMKAASNSNSSLIAKVLSESHLHPYKRGALLRVIIGAGDFEYIQMSQVFSELSNNSPIVFTSRFAERRVGHWATTSGFIDAHSGDANYEHAWVLSGVSRGLKRQGDVWFHLRNSWGLDWGRLGGAYLNALHCSLNQCHFLRIKKISLVEIHPKDSIKSARVVPSASLSTTNDSFAESDAEEPEESLIDEGDVHTDVERY